jgi:hypothetical protein
LFFLKKQKTFIDGQYVCSPGQPREVRAAGDPAVVRTRERGARAAQIIAPRGRLAEVRDMLPAWWVRALGLDDVQTPSAPDARTDPARDGEIIWLPPGALDAQQRSVCSSPFCAEDGAAARRK